jgi:hypothetical protein
VFFIFQVSPDIYGDTHTHFYTHWTVSFLIFMYYKILQPPLDGINHTSKQRDGYGRSGCYNMECPGFQLEQGSKISPGAIIDSTSTTGRSRHTITIKVFKVGESYQILSIC